jgi:hypothetical protein
MSQTHRGETLTPGALVPKDAPYCLAFLWEANTGISGAVLWVVASTDENDPWGPRLGVTLLPGPNVKATTRPTDAWVVFADEHRVVGSLPDDVEAKVLDFVHRNIGVLLGHWRGELDTPSCLERLELCRL